MKSEEDIYKGTIIVMVTTALTMLKADFDEIFRSIWIKLGQPLIDSEEVIQKCNEILPLSYSRIDHDFLYEFITEARFTEHSFHYNNPRKIERLNSSLVFLGMICNRI